MKKNEQKGKSKLQAFRDRKISYKISVATGVLLVICLTVMIAISASLAAATLNKTVYSEFEGVALQNGIKVQSVLDDAAATAKIFQDYMVKQYEKYDEEGYSGVTEQSDVYDVKLQEMNKEIEDFIISVARTKVESSDEFAGIGVFFEPDAFDPGIKDYTVYINEEDAANGKVQSYGEYDSYGSEDYYKDLIVVSFNEIESDVELRSIGMVSLDKTEAE